MQLQTYTHTPYYLLMFIGVTRNVMIDEKDRMTTTRHNILEAAEIYQGGIQRI